MWWAGYEWHPVPLPPTAASQVAKLASKHRGDQLTACVDLLRRAGLDVERVLDALASTDTGDILEFIAQILEDDSPRPWKSTVGLCRSTVSQWHTIRGRLIDKGIPDPLRALPSLTALLDVVEIMLLDGMEKKEDRERFLRDLYRRDTVTQSGPPPGWEDGAELDGLF